MAQSANGNRPQGPQSGKVVDDANRPRVVQIPLRGCIGSGHRPDLPVLDREPETALGFGSAESGRGATKAVTDAASLATISPVIRHLLALGKPNMNPVFRDEQLGWARSILYSAGPVNSYREIVACRTIIMLSQNAAERDAATRVQKDARVRFSEGDTPMKFDADKWMEIGLLALAAGCFAGFIAAIALP